MYKRGAIQVNNSNFGILQVISVSLDVHSKLKYIYCFPVQTSFFTRCPGRLTSFFTPILRPAHFPDGNLMLYYLA